MDECSESFRKCELSLEEKFFLFRIWKVFLENVVLEMDFKGSNFGRIGCKEGS